MSTLFSQTRRSSQKDADAASHDLLVRAGFIRALASGIYSYLPLGLRVARKIEAIVRSEMNRIGGQEILMPVINPADIWKESGRWYRIDAEMGRFVDRGGRDMVLAMTHEEVAADIARNEISSYRQLPQLIYHIQTKWRDDPRPRSGLIRVREFTMKDSYSLDRDFQGLESQYQAHMDAYRRIFQRCGVPTIAVKSDLGMMGGRMAHEFIYLNDVGEDTIIRCESCGYSANRQVAAFRKLKTPQEDQEEISKVQTPGASTIEALADFLKADRHKLAKAVFMVASRTEATETVEQLVIAVIPGDMEVNETKLSVAAGAAGLRPARDEEIRACGVEPGYGSPIGAKSAYVVADDSIPGIPNMVAGANSADAHYLNVNYGRDYDAEVVADIAVASEGDSCPDCGEAMTSCKGVEVGHVFQLGTYYSDKLGCRYLDKDGAEKPIVMGSYGIGIGRLLACIAEQHHDDNGLIWPKEVAPFDVHIVDLLRESDRGEKLCRDLEEMGIEVLHDDRSERAGVKFNDADLIGIPVRITIGDRSLEKGGVELKDRETGDSKLVTFEELKGALSLPDGQPIEYTAPDGTRRDA